MDKEATNAGEASVKDGESGKKFHLRNLHYFNCYAISYNNVLVII